jgi:uncharacterized surface protein with fasciclin (FAS1) repeats
MKKAKLIAFILTLAASLFAATTTTVFAHGGDEAKGKCRKEKLASFNGTIAQAAAQTPELSTLFSLVGAAGLGSALDGPGPLTVYAPVNSAFAKVPAGLVDLLTADPKGLLTTVLTYHVSEGLRDPRRSKNTREIKTLQGQTVFFNYAKGNTAQVNQSNVNCQGVRTSNGVVWLIDSVLLPQF